VSRRERPVTGLGHNHRGPESPAAPYIGGKKQLARKICAIIETSHEIYAEGFVGPNRTLGYER
jgi:hypothetical protein